VELTQTIESCPAISGNQWNSHLALQFELPDSEVQLQRSHYNVLEPSHDSNIFSPNLLLASTGHRLISLLNRGNQFYVQDGRTLSALLICENEPARHFSHAVGCPRGNPLAEARAWVVPWFVSRTTSKVPPETASRHYAVDVLAPDVELLSLTRNQDSLQIRLANLSGRQSETALKLANPIAAAWITTLTGERRQPLTVRDNQYIDLTLRPSDIVQVEVRN